VVGIGGSVVIPAIPEQVGPAYPLKQKQLNVVLLLTMQTPRPPHGLLAHGFTGGRTVVVVA